MLDRIVIVGAGRTAESLIGRLRKMAPTLVLDSAPEPLEAIQTPGEDEPIAEPDDPSAPVFDLTKRLADGTSRFVLEEARGDAREAVGVVAATPDDRKNIEICRLARELAYKPVLGIAIDPKAAPGYEAVGARAIVRASILGQVVERALRDDGLVIATTVGLGKGEIVEVQVLPGSPAIGVPLAHLSAEAWRVAAIYRRGELVLPTGRTAIEAEDRVVIVGDPSILPGVAAQLRIGAPMFPLPHGRSVVAYMPGGRDRAVEAEAEMLALHTAAGSLVRLYPRETSATAALVEDLGLPERSSALRAKTVDDVPLSGEQVIDHVAQLRRLRPGVVVVKDAERSLLARILGRGGAPAALCDAVRAPVLFPRGSPGYARVVHAMVQGVEGAAIADAAIDLARMFGVPLVMVRVSLPAYLGTTDPDADRVAALVEKRSRLFGLHAETVALTGNPVTELARVAAPTDLLVIGRRASTRDSFTSPDIALRVARGASCSVLVKTAGVV